MRGTVAPQGQSAIRPQGRQSQSMQRSQSQANRWLSRFSSRAVSLPGQGAGELKMMLTLGPFSPLSPFPSTHNLLHRVVVVKPSAVTGRCYLLLSKRRRSSSR